MYSYFMKILYFYDVFISKLCNDWFELALHNATNTFEQGGSL